MKYLKLIVASVFLLALFSLGSASAASPTGSSTTFGKDACSALKSDVSSSGCSNGDGIEEIAKNVVNIMSIVVGILAVIMLIVAGLRFITAGGNSNSVAGARNTLIYALVGVVVAVLAQLLVHLVLNTANNVQNNSYLNNSEVIGNDA